MICTYKKNEQRTATLTDLEITRKTKNQKPKTI